MRGGVSVSRSLVPLPFSCLPYRASLGVIARARSLSLVCLSVCTPLYVHADAHE